MMNEEEYIRNKMGQKNPFKVPNGYFDKLTQQVMDRLSEQQTDRLPEQQTNEQQTKKKSAIIRHLRPLLYAAACICIAVFTATFFFGSHVEEDDTMANAQQDATYSDTYIDEAADYAMIDNEDIYYGLLADI